MGSARAPRSSPIQNVGGTQRPTCLCVGTFWVLALTRGVPERRTFSVSVVTPGQQVWGRQKATTALRTAPLPTWGRGRREQASQGPDSSTEGLA